MLESLRSRSTHRRFSTVGANTSAPTGCPARDTCAADCLADLHSGAAENEATSQNETNRGRHAMTSFRQIEATPEIIRDYQNR